MQLVSTAYRLAGNVTQYHDHAITETQVALQITTLSKINIKKDTFLDIITRSAAVAEIDDRTFVCSDIFVVPTYGIATLPQSIVMELWNFWGLGVRGLRVGEGG